MWPDYPPRQILLSPPPGIGTVETAPGTIELANVTFADPATRQDDITLLQSAVLAGGTTAPTYLYQFRPPGNGLDMRGGTVSLTITYEVAGRTQQLRIDNVPVR